MIDGHQRVWENEIDPKDDAKVELTFSSHTRQYSWPNYTFEKRYYVFHAITRFVCVSVCVCVCLCVCVSVCLSSRLRRDGWT